LGDAKTVTNLYAPKAVRLDTQYGENQQGSSAIKYFAVKLFTWYHGVNLELLQSFGEGTTVIVKGGLYTIHVSDQAGQPCDIYVFIITEAIRGKDS
jgi:hypothetical protein